MKFEHLIKEYLDSPAYQGLAERSKAMYQIYMTKLAEIGERAPLTDADMPIAVAVARSRSKVEADRMAGKKPKLNESAKNLSQFWWFSIDNREDEKGNEVSNSQKNTLASYLKIVYRYAMNNGYIKVTENFTTSIPRWTHVVDIGNPLTDADIVTIERAIEDGTMPEDLVCYAKWWIFLYDGGLRPGETYEHERAWFRKSHKAMLFEVWDAKGREKGKVSRYSLLTERQKDILAWFDKQPNVNQVVRYTFRTNRGKPFLSTYALDKIKEICTLVGMEPKTIYDSRRGIATTLYAEVQAGTRSFKEVKDRLGHIKEETTKRYISQDELTKALGYRAPKPINHPDAEVHW